MFDFLKTAYDAGIQAAWEKLGGMPLAFSGQKILNRLQSPGSAALHRLANPPGPLKAPRPQLAAGELPKPHVFSPQPSAAPVR
jgi:hypothetical protein